MKTPRSCFHQIILFAIAICFIPLAQAQITPFMVDFETGSGYTTGQLSTNSLWVRADTGVLVTNTNPLAGSQSLLLPSGIFSDGANLFIDAPDSATNLNITLLFKPTDSAGFNFGAGGRILLYTETNSDPSDGGDVIAFEFQFKIDNQVQTIQVGFNGGSVSGSTPWVADTSYTLGLSVDIAGSSMGYTLMAGETAVATGSGSYTAQSGNQFVLRLLGETGSSGALVDSIGVTSAVPEPSTYAAFAGLAVLGLAMWRKRAAPSVMGKLT